MDERLWRKVDAIHQFGIEHGWAVEYSETPVEGCTSAVQVNGFRTDRHPDADEGVTFGFVIAWAIRERTDRVITLGMDGRKPAFIMGVDDGSDEWWFGGAKAWREALQDPAHWCGVEVPAPA